MTVTDAPVDTAAGRTLTAIAETTILSALGSGVRWTPTLADMSDPLRRTGASFVSLHRESALLGCIGSIAPTRPLATDVAENALGAAFADPRLPAVTMHDYEAMEISVSVLGRLRRMNVASYEELTGTVRPGVDGLVVSTTHHRATFLPAVWPQLSGVDEFIGMLWHKAGMAPGSWPTSIVVERYETVEFTSSGPRPTILRGDAEQSG